MTGSNVARASLAAACVLAFAAHAADVSTNAPATGPRTQGGAMAPPAPGARPSDATRITGAGRVDAARGRYVAILGGCNDCHTEGFAASGGRTPEAQWLQGDGGLGFRGPWGTTYAPNLRKVVAGKSEQEWVDYARALKSRPPMPYWAVNQMRENDLRSLYRFIRQLGPPGEAVTPFVPPEASPKGPVIQWPAPPK